MARKQSQRPGRGGIDLDKDRDAAAGVKGAEQPGRRTMPWARGVHGTAMAAPLSKGATNLDASGVPVPDLFDVITFFRARGDSYPIIASIGFWTKENPGKALTARGLKLWYETELKRRLSGKPQGSKRT
jgi:hypothetical protein